MTWSNIKQYRESCKRANTPENFAVIKIIARKSNECPWCAINNCVNQRQK